MHLKYLESGVEIIFSAQHHPAEGLGDVADNEEEGDGAEHEDDVLLPVGHGQGLPPGISTPAQGLLQLGDVRHKSGGVTNLVVHFRTPPGLNGIIR